MRIAVGVLLMAVHLGCTLAKDVLNQIRLNQVNYFKRAFNHLQKK